jgi:hypothetical protein
LPNFLYTATNVSALSTTVPDAANLTSVTLGNSVTSIGDDAFLDCTSLTSVTIPNSVTSIGTYAFLGCNALQTITIPNSVTSIGTYVFLGCNALQTITIPNSVTSIGTYAFLDSGLTTVIIANGQLTNIPSPSTGVSFFGRTVNTFTTAGDVEGQLPTGLGIFSGFSFRNSLNYPGVGPSGDFTLEFFIKTSASQNQQYPLSLSGTELYFSVEYGIFSIVHNDGLGNTIFINKPNKWHHIALTRSENTLRVFFNGILTLTLTGINVNLTNAAMHIGNFRLGYYGVSQQVHFLGSLSNIRLSDTVLYTTNFTRPSLPLSSSATTRFLLLGTNPSNRYEDSGYLNSAVTGSATVTIS